MDLEETAKKYIERLESYYEMIRKYPKYDLKYDNLSLAPIIGFDKRNSFMSMNSFIDELSKIYLSEKEEDRELALEINYQLRNSKTFKRNSGCEEEKIIPFALEFANAGFPYSQFTFDYFKKHWEEELINSYYIGRAWGYSPKQIKRDDGLIMFSVLNKIGNILSAEEIQSSGILDIPIENMNYVIKAILNDDYPNKGISEKTVKLLNGLHGIENPYKAYEYSYIVGKVIEYPSLAEKLQYLPDIEWKVEGISEGNNHLYYIDECINFDYISSTKEYIDMICSGETLKNYFYITTSAEYRNDENNKVLNHIYRLLMDKDVPKDMAKYLLDSEETENIFSYISSRPDIMEKILNTEKIEESSDNFIYRLARINGYKSPIDDIEHRNFVYKYPNTKEAYFFDTSISYANKNHEQITSILMLSDSTDFELICLLMQNEYFINERDYTRKAIDTILLLDNGQKKQIYNNLLENNKRWDFEYFIDVFDDSIYKKSKKIRGYYDLLILKYFQAEDESLHLNEVIKQRMKSCCERNIIQPLLNNFILSFQTVRDDRIENESEYKELLNDQVCEYLTRDKDISTHYREKQERIKKRLIKKYFERKKSKGNSN